MAIKIERIEKDRVVFSEEVTKCKQCETQMLRWWSDLAKLQTMCLPGIVKETYREGGVCETCVQKGKYPKECGTCFKEKLYPEDFGYELTFYAKYPEGETDYVYICKACIEQSPKEVLETTIEADDVEEVVSRRK